jgi:hypothetical protein
VGAREPAIPAIALSLFPAKALGVRRKMSSLAGIHTEIFQGLLSFTTYGEKVVEKQNKSLGITV